VSEKKTGFNGLFAGKNKSNKPLKRVFFISKVC